MPAHVGPTSYGSACVTAIGRSGAQLRLHPGTAVASGRCLQLKIACLASAWHATAVVREQDNFSALNSLEFSSVKACIIHVDALELEPDPAPTRTPELDPTPTRNRPDGQSGHKLECACAQAHTHVTESDSNLQGECVWYYNSGRLSLC
eukprot:360219-Chlamydomonas_euryale.AAC.1